jgi:Dolichyl-phosphate-mannose-protein mannosyltransferase
MPFLQNLIHKFEVSSESHQLTRYLKVGLACLAVLLLLVVNNWRSFRNFNTQEAMDAAQLGRNLADGNGYTTQFIRPFSIYLIKKHNEAKYGLMPAPNADYAEIKGRHPDIANPPVYPCLLAALMRILPFKYPVDNTHLFWSVPLNDGSRTFWRYEPDFLISLFNQLLFLIIVVLTFLLARRLFDPGVAWLSGGLLLGCELLWRFCISGLSTMLLMLIFMGLVWCLVYIEREAREPKWKPWSLLLLAVVAGLLIGLGTLTRYAFGWIIVPVIVFFILFVDSHKVALCSLALVAFCVVLAPWTYRNYRICGVPFGAATYTVVEGTSAFPDHKLERSLQPDFLQADIGLRTFAHKLLNNSRQILQNDVPKLGGTWLTSLFLVGLLLGFRSPGIRRLRYFLVLSLVMLVAVEALGRTQLSEDSPQVNSENLLVLLLPVVIIYGASLFFLLLNQMELQFHKARYVVVAVFAFIMCLPMVFAFAPPKTVPVAYPPYYPPIIQQVSGWMKENELMMSDIPWAVAWYGNRQCILTTLDAQKEFYSVNDMIKPIRALYLTPQTADGRFLTQLTSGWGIFFVGTLQNFPLREKLPKELWIEKWHQLVTGQMFLTDYPRWKVERTGSATADTPADAATEK